MNKTVEIITKSRRQAPCFSNGDVINNSLVTENAFSKSKSNTIVIARAGHGMSFSNKRILLNNRDLTKNRRKP